MPTYPHIERYHADKQRFIEFGGSDQEQSIRRAFAVCLDSYCREHREKLALVDELEARLHNRPDGTVKDSLRMDRGHWEAKDTHDDLDIEIQHKFNRGYPQDNILFEDSQTAVLFQNREEAMRADMSRPGDLHRLIRAFLDYELPQIEEFRQAQQQFKADFANLMPLADRQTKFAKTADGEQAVFGLFTSGAKTNRDEWVFDFDVRNLRDKAFFFADTYNELLDNGDNSRVPVIKWSSTLEDRFRHGERIVYNDANWGQTLHRPFVVKQHFAEVVMNDRLTQNHYEMFGSDLKHPNEVICFRGLGTNKPFNVLATDRLVEHQVLMNMQCLPLYRYTAEGERISNITE